MKLLFPQPMYHLYTNYTQFLRNSQSLLLQSLWYKESLPRQFLLLFLPDINFEALFPLNI